MTFLANDSHNKIIIIISFIYRKLTCITKKITKIQLFFKIYFRFYFKKFSKFLYTFFYKSYRYGISKCKFYLVYDFILKLFIIYSSEILLVLLDHYQAAFRPPINIQSHA